MEAEIIRLSSEPAGVMEDSAAQRFHLAVRRSGDREIQHGLEAGEFSLAVHQRHGALLFGGHVGMPLQRRWSDVDEDQFRHQVGRDGGQPYSGQPAERHAHHELGGRCELVQHRHQGLGVVLG